ncbi:hypothetical protein BDB00DRAFT_847661 [Zychaea mexicana]|uniref:uncharacterized protein n=1 Tax=Zychaea mexicana TaxID=64656 RepID=UPI0022FF285E|nr:uncharacterized protein BDB00DRAFT_847661 [Zychaea mexicana]KAI9488531.1 hypothetical protein BDB00DRAFT_847661 [Zychaea mexicana]
MSAHLDQYIHWLKENGATYEKLDFKADAEGIGSVYATTKVNNGECLATLPFRLAITEKVARNALPTLNQHSSRNVVALFLAQQKKLADKSFYAPYLNMLPEKIMTGLCFEENDMRYLENTNLFLAIEGRKQNVFNDFQRLIGDSPESKDVTWAEFLWGYTVLSSRSFPYSLIDPGYDGPSEVLFPLLDALNHKPNTQITWMRNGDVENGSLSFVIGHDVAPGEQLFNNYGPKSNEELLLGYGFCFEDNEYDHVALKPNISMDPNAQAKMDIIRQANVASFSEDDPLLNYIHQNSIPASFYKLMRIMVMNELELSCYQNCTDAAQLDFVGYRNEIAMLNTINALLQTRLRAIRNFTIDCKNITQWQRYALMYRKGQEAVLTSVLAKIDEEKSSVLRRMAVVSEPAPAAPFLDIVNPGYFMHETKQAESNTVVMLDSVVITLNHLLQRNPQFKMAIGQLFEDIEEERDVVMMLALIQERSKGENSKWHTFFNRTENITKPDTEAVEDLQELYDSLFPAFTDAFPDIFRDAIFSFDALLWAEDILNNYSLHNPMVIVPI